MAFEIETDERVAVRDVTDRVADRVPATLDRGACTVFVHHTTAGVVVQEAESRLLGDATDLLASLAPTGAGYAHDDLDGNADAHLRTLLLGSSVTVPVRDGALDLGTWQSVLVVECDGPRTRRVSVTTTPAAE